MKFDRSKLQFLLVGAAVLFAGSILAIQAHAADCRTEPSVLESGDLARNSGLQGHVAGHVHGATRPTAGWPTYLDKSQFKTADAYKSAWTAYLDTTKVTAADAADCGGTGTSTRKWVSASKLGKTSIPYDKCTNADCSLTTEGDAAGVMFTFDKKSFARPSGSGTVQKWILNTAYPSARP